MHRNIDIILYHLHIELARFATLSILIVIDTVIARHVRAYLWSVSIVCLRSVSIAEATSVHGWIPAITTTWVIWQGELIFLTICWVLFFQCLLFGLLQYLCMGWYWPDRRLSWMAEWFVSVKFFILFHLHFQEAAYSSGIKRVFPNSHLVYLETPVYSVRKQIQKGHMDAKSMKPAFHFYCLWNSFRHFLFLHDQSASDLRLLCSRAWTNSCMLNLHRLNGTSVNLARVCCVCTCRSVTERTWQHVCAQRIHPILCAHFHYQLLPPIGLYVSATVCCSTLETACTWPTLSSPPAC